MKMDFNQNKWSFMSLLLAGLGSVVWIAFFISQALSETNTVFVGSVLSRMTLLWTLVMAPAGIILGWIGKKKQNRHADWAILGNVVVLLFQPFIGVIAFVTSLWFDCWQGWTC